MIWKAYFWFFLILSIPSLFGAYATLWEWAIDLPFLVIQAVSIFGFAWQKPIGKQGFWKIYAPICIIWNLGHALFALKTLVPLIATILYLPSLYATFAYANLRPSIWGNNPIDNNAASKP